MAGGGGAGSMRSMNDKVRENREALKTSDHSKSYLKANSIPYNRRVGGKHIVGLGIGLALTCILILIVSMAISNYTNYEKQLQVETPSIVSSDSSAYHLIMEAASYNMFKGYYKEAVTEYENALKLFPNDSLANIGLIKAAQLAFNK